MKFTTDFVAQVAQLANFTIDKEQEKELAQSFDDSLTNIELLNKVNTQGIEPTYQVNNLVNVMRADEINEANQFSQKEALSNAAATHDGYFVVKRVIDHDDA
ncbi:MAG: Asp-tRNA(Asn)/Glu-tRNA(Gln) amidotransferase subunit GatC [bacterium]|nr:Asp-tRNA(Asn)/Glu-tRNA(Gln) amidotransferase subunit GatC [bacterium]